MKIPRVYRAEAVVLHQVRTAEADRILTIYSPTFGKARVVARGVLRPTSHMAGHLEVFSRSSLLLAHGRGMDIVTQAQSIETFPSIREELPRFSCALYAAELLDRLSEAEDRAPAGAAVAEGRAAYHTDRGETGRIYDLLLTFLRWVAEGSPELALRYFEVQVLALSGYGPELYECLSCGRPLSPEVNGFSGAAGGVLCPDCLSSETGVRPITLNALKVLRLLQGGSSEQARRLRLDPALARELEQLLRYYLPHVLERELRSAAFLDTVRSGALAAAPPAVRGRPA